MQIRSNLPRRRGTRLLHAIVSTACLCAALAACGGDDAPSAGTAPAVTLSAFAAADVVEIRRAHV